MDAPQSEPTVESKVVYRGKILNLRIDTVRLPNRRLATREIAEHSNSVCVVPVDRQGNVLLVRQYRKPAEAPLLEAPAGGMEEGEVPEAAARRELQEEAGFTSDHLRRMTGFWLAPGWCTEYMHAYLATDLRPARLEADDDENIEVVPVPLGHIPELIESGQIQDAKSIAALLLALRILGRDDPGG